MKLKSEDYYRAQQLGSNYIRDYSYKHGEDISKFMKKYDIVESTFGQIMDVVGRQKETVHRLYGHHFIYDFPISEPEHIGDFIEHEFSDLFTKQGLPILPGELLKNTNLIKYCKSLTHNWNFVNGFDILVGTIAIYSGTNELQKMLKQVDSIETFSEFAKSIGIGGIELAISISTANPFLLIGAVLQLAANFKGNINDGSVVYFQKMHNGLKIEFSIKAKKINTSIKKKKTKHKIEDRKIKTSITRKKSKMGKPQ
jgi:hypothetical protein